jgi:CPA2 family monovalent cation:H+ antiporter-2
MHHTPLIATIVAGLVIAFLFGAIAHRLRVPPIAGYLLAGVMVGPFTPGFVADTNLASELAEIGVILLMFGVGLHFSVRDLMAVRSIAIPGAVVQIAVATAMGAGLGMLLGWPLLGGIVFGLALSVASTVVLLRALQSRDLVDTERGRIAVGWLIVEDLVMVLTLVLLPAIAAALASDGARGLGGVAMSLGTTLLKVGGFVALMLIVGPRIIPRLLHWVAHSGSRELFRLAVLAIALGVAFGAATIFGVSLALGAFFAGMILGETPLSRRATEETLPLRDAFAVLFFVSVGMLFNPSIVVERPLALVATVAIIVIGKSLAAFAIVRLFRHPTGTALTIAASLAQIGEFSFILVALGTELKVLPADGRDLVLAGALISIFLNSFLFSAVARLKAQGHVEEEEDGGTASQGAGDALILVGYGRVGRLVAKAMVEAGMHVRLIEAESDIARAAESDGLEVVTGNALEPRVLTAAGLATAKRLLIAIPEGFEAGAITERARTLNPTIEVIARAHSDAQEAHIRERGAAHVILGEREIALRMCELAR